MVATEFGRGQQLGWAGRYELERLLGTGGMASVWLASDATLLRPVAVKLLADTLALDAEYVARFEREARVAAGLSHPHLVKVFDFSVAAGRPFLVMEYIAGGSLARPLVPLPDPDPLVRGLLEALDYIHRAGIVHRDVKPANVLVGTDGKARLTDFGIAQPAEASQLTRTGIVLGSERYIAPEVARGGRATSHSDLYACGILIRECFDSSTRPRLARLAGALTAADPRERPASAAAALALLGKAPVPTRRQTIPRPSPALRPDPASLRAPTGVTTVRNRPGPTSLRTATRETTVRHRLGPAPSRLGRSRRARVAAALALVVAVTLVALIALRGAGAPLSGRPGPTLTPASAPLSVQLSSLDRAVGRSRR